MSSFFSVHPSVQVSLIFCVRSQQNLCNTKKPLNYPYAAQPDVMNVLNGYASDLNLMEENSQSLMLSEFIDEFVLFGIRVCYC